MSGGRKGRDLLIRVETVPGTGVYETLAGIRTSEVQITATGVDATAADSPDAWRELLPGAAVRSARVSGAGVFKSTAADARLRGVALGEGVAGFDLVMPGIGRLRGPFHVSRLTWTGRHDGEVGFSIVLDSAGAVAVLPPDADGAVL